MFTFWLNRFPERYKYALHVVNHKTNEEVSCGYDSYLDAEGIENFLKVAGVEYGAYSRELDGKNWERIQ